MKNYTDYNDNCFLTQKLKKILVKYMREEQKNGRKENETINEKYLNI